MDTGDWPAYFLEIPRVGKIMSKDDNLYDWIVDQDCSAQPKTETVREMHERLQAEIKAEHANELAKILMNNLERYPFKP
jgi:hypothetical protein